MSAVSDDTESEGGDGQLYFESEVEQQSFRQKHILQDAPDFQPKAGQVINAYLGMDAGSTTTKLVLMNEDEEIIDSFYASNEGNPIDVASRALLAMYDKYRNVGATLNIIAAASYT